jgi:hypothetical protein
MIDWRLIVSSGLASASIAACLTYLMAPPWQVQAIERPPVPVPTKVQGDVVLNQGARLPSAEEKAVADFEAAAEAILRKAPNTRASVVTDVPSLAAKILMPKSRPPGAP